MRACIRSYEGRGARHSNTYVVPTTPARTLVSPMALSKSLSHAVADECLNSFNGSDAIRFRNGSACELVDPKDELSPEKPALGRC